MALLFIQPGKPAQNTFAEPFDGRLGDECLNETWFWTLAGAQVSIEEWRVEYNEGRRHSSLAGLPPAVFASRFRRGNPQPSGRT